VPTELDRASDSDAPSRAAEVLDRLVRDRPSGGSLRRSWQRRREPAHPESAEGDLGPVGSPWDWLRRRAAIALVVLVLSAAVAGVTFFRRPPPIEDRLPVAGEPGSVPSTSAAGAADPAPGAEGGAEEGDAGNDGAANDGAAGGGDGAAGGPTQVVVHVAGAVTSPGVVRLSTGSRVVDAVSAAGGLRADADPDRVNLAAPLTDGQRVVVPDLGQPAPVDVGGGAGTAATPGADGAAGGGSVPGPVDLNSATAEQLDTLPGVGPSTAAAIIEHRDSAGPFRSVDALLDVRGIGEAKLEALRDLVTVGGS
jgi:competence protein ComEA